jgi:F0F1-type ATP synthase delta subunit
MNERIKELLKQASKLANTDDNKDIDRNFDMIVAEKFAELIIKETMQVVANTVAWNGYLNAAEAVIEHFKE